MEKKSEIQGKRMGSSLDKATFTEKTGKSVMNKHYIQFLHLPRGHCGACGVGGGHAVRVEDAFELKANNWEGCRALNQ